MLKRDSTELYCNRVMFPTSYSQLDIYAYFCFMYHLSLSGFYSGIKMACDTSLPISCYIALHFQTSFSLSSFLFFKGSSDGLKIGIRYEE